MRPGVRLREVNLAARLGVSRTAAREALARLEGEGMIAVEGRGFVILELTDTDIEEIRQFRFPRVLTLGNAAARKTALTDMKNIHFPSRSRRPSFKAEVSCGACWSTPFARRQGSTATGPCHALAEDPMIGNGYEES